MNWHATYNDTWCLQNSALLSNPESRAKFEENTFVSDMGFPGFSNVLYPSMNSRSEGWSDLDSPTQDYFLMLSRIEKDIERIFSDIFATKYSICSAVDSKDLSRLEHTMIYTAAITLHNMQLKWEGRSILHGPLKKLANFVYA